jgi:hypothetical protein
VGLVKIIAIILKEVFEMRKESVRKGIRVMIILPLLLSCSPVSSSWGCKGNLTGSCRTISEIDDNSLSFDDEKNLRDFKEQKTQGNTNDSHSFDIYRSKEKVARVLFAPYIDKAGNRHDKSIVYYLERKSNWKGGR